MIDGELKMKMESKDGRKITLELSEHDTLQILALVRKELKRSDKIWQPYWESQIRKIQQFIEQASLAQCSVWPEDVFSKDENDADPNGVLNLQGSL
jgi:hypothetical protein